jgi:hypothetical protein
VQTHHLPTTVLTLFRNASFSWEQAAGTHPLANCHVGKHTWPGGHKAAQQHCSGRYACARKCLQKVLSLFQSQTEPCQ